MNTAEMTVTFINYDEVISVSQSLVEAGEALGLPSYIIALWVSDYLRKNIKIWVH